MSTTKAILLVDDEESDIYLTCYAFDKLGINHPIVVAKNGRQAIDELKNRLSLPVSEQSSRFGLVLLDLNMPGLNGFDVLTWRATQPALLNLPFVILTSSGLDSDRKRALALGASDFRVKPSTLDELVALTRDLYNRWLLGKELSASPQPRPVFNGSAKLASIL